MSPIEEAFRAFHAENPGVYRQLVHLARRLKDRGHQRVGMKSLFEVLRWHRLMTTTSPDEFRLNNNYTSYYARLIMAREPELDGLFETRRLHAVEPLDAPVPDEEPVDVPDHGRLFDLGDAA